MIMLKLLITVPCYNEELVLEKTIFEIMDYAKLHLKQYDWHILILDNNSTDNTWNIAESLAAKDNRIITLQVKIPGRGAALRTAWRSLLDYDIYSYMDADLATDIKDFSFIIDRVKEGYNLVTGSRYVEYADVKRDFKRKMLSKIYNMLIKLALHVNFQDAQCGFKAFDKKIVTDLVPQTIDDGWFWDTELMILADRMGYKILEVPVSWREVRDELRRSKVSHWQEVRRQLGNIYTMKKRLAKNYYGRKAL